MNDRLSKISQTAIQFRDERDWKQFHDPKNLAEAISNSALLTIRFWIEFADLKMFGKNRNLQKVS